jgi:adenylate cyclase
VRRVKAWGAWRRNARLVLIGVVAAGAALLAYGFGFIHAVELDSMDTRFKVRGDRDPPSDLVVVAIDERSVDDYGPWPFPRSIHGRLIDRLRQAGVAQIAYDVQFTQATKPREDFALYDAAGRAGNVVFATTQVDSRGRHNVLGGEANLRRIGAHAGYSAFVADPSAIFRKVGYAPQKLKSFAVVTVEAESGRPVDPDEFPDGSAWIDYYGPPDTFPQVPFWKVIEKRIPPGSLRGKTAVVGATAPLLQDLHPSPFGDLTSGPEIQANAIATVEEGPPLRSTPVTVDVALIVLLSMAGALLNLRLRPTWALVAALGVGGAYLIAAQLAFDADRIVPVVYPLLGLSVASIGSLGVEYLFEAFHRQRTRDAFARFVPDAVVDELLESTEELRLGGRRVEATALFSDIRGFTTFSESRPPEEVLDILNRYLSEMTEAILDHGGTLISFMGDGIYAIFGAPIELDDHADRALAASREMLGPRLGAFNSWVSERRLTEPFRMGVGLNTGEVMAGQVGSERRLEYTAIGDTVNTASRLEGMTKGTPHQLFISESTRARLRGAAAAELTYVDELAVRGRAVGIKVWTDPATSEAPAADASWEADATWEPTA